MTDRQRVLIHSLLAAPGLNGMMGVISGEDHAKGRLWVELDNHDTMSLRSVDPVFVVPAPGERAHVLRHESVPVQE